MKKSLSRIPGGPLDRPIHVWTYGHFGPPLVVFPSASGLAHEWDSHGMIDALRDLIDGGKLKVYCLESNVSEAWTRKENPPEWRIDRHRRYERWLIEQFVPWVYADLGGPMPLTTSGVSLGAFYAANAVLKHSEEFRYALCMSGMYDTQAMLGDLVSPEVHYSNPMAYVPGLSGDLLKTIADRVHLDLICGQGKWEDTNIDETRRFHAVLTARGISAHIDLWGHDVDHEWIWWRRQALMYLGRRFGES
jgi:esterase/lipase superfamily enzyme